MKQKNLSRWLKCILLGVGICGLIIYGVILPLYGDSLAASYPEFANRFWPWMGFLWVTAVPCFAVLVLAWRIATNIGRDRSFSNENASLLKWISVLAAADAAFFFPGKRGNALTGYEPSQRGTGFFYHRIRGYRRCGHIRCIIPFSKKSRRSAGRKRLDHIGGCYGRRNHFQY